MECLGCRIANRLEPGVQIVYEDQYVACVLDIAPFNDGHLLIMPKEHYLDVEEMDEATSTHIMRVSVTMSQLLKRAFRPDGITICQNGGVFNDLGHYHMHVIPRYEGDGFAWSEPKEGFLSGRPLNEVKEKLVRALEAPEPATAPESASATASELLSAPGEPPKE
ncbi:HIT family protein [Paenibacillus sp. FSL H7-0357]|uniref:HIT family protein n=1 Tax=Paenibacillus sp. FSL H7-0357 TaxID=1536774 RepID=UPI0007C71305|nr:HIT family protein [Paenibacillus sp. FSL H7-0357]